MRKRKWKWRLCEIALILCCFSVLFCVFSVGKLPYFQNADDYTLYFGTSSGGQLRTDTPFWDKLTRKTTGESARYAGNKKGELIANFEAEVKFMEEAGGIVNYYCYSPLITEKITLNGQEINLHIAVGKGYTVVGAPVIFGGY